MTMAGIPIERQKAMLAAATGAQLTVGQVKETGGYTGGKPVAEGFKRKWKASTRKHKPKQPKQPKPKAAKPKTSPAPKKGGMKTLSSKKTWKKSNGMGVQTKSIPQSAAEAIGGSIRRRQTRSGSVVVSSAPPSTPFDPQAAAEDMYESFSGYVGDWAGTDRKKEDEEKTNGIWIYGRGFKFV